MYLNNKKVCEVTGRRENPVGARRNRRKGRIGGRGTSGGISRRRMEKRLCISNLNGRDGGLCVGGICPGGVLRRRQRKHSTVWLRAVGMRAWA